MSAAFDPYHKWLGIPPAEQPPNYYRLLGIAPFESDPDVIAHAADQRISHVRAFQIGKHSDESQQLLRAISTARVCLLNNEKKAQYDAPLRASIAAASRAPQALPPGGMVSVRPETGGPLASGSAKRWQHATLGAGLLAAVALLVLMAVRWGGSVGDAGPTAAGTPAPSETPATPSAAQEGTLSDEALRTAPTAARPASAPPPPPLAATAAADAADPPAAPSVLGAREQHSDAASDGETWVAEESAVPTEPARAEPAVVPLETMLPVEPPAAVSSLDPLLPLPDSAPAGGATPASPQPPAPPSADIPVPPERPVVAEDQQRPASKPAVPDTAARAAARKQVEDVFAAQIDAATTAQNKSDLAGEFGRLAQETRDDAAARYVLFEDAIKLAIQAADLDLALTSIDGLEEAFEVNGWPLRKNAFKEMAGRFTAPQLAGQYADTAMEVVERAVGAERFDDALDLHKVATAAAARSGAAERRTAVRRRGTEIEILQKQWSLAQLARQRLKTEPENAKANLALGKYLCLGKQQWTEGLLYLAQGDDESLRQAAEKDFAATKEPSRKAEAAEAWWDAAQRTKTPERHTMLARAGFWYEQCLTDASGLARVRVEQRLQQIEKDHPGWRETADPAMRLAGTPKPRSVGQPVKNLPPGAAEAGRPAKAASQPGPQIPPAAPAKPPVASVIPSPAVTTAPGLNPCVMLNSGANADSLAISPDGKLIVAGLASGEIIVWELRTGRALRTFAAHTASTLRVTFSPNGRMLVSGGADSAAKVWDTATWQELRTHRGSFDRALLNQLHFSADGTRLVVAGYTAETLWCDAASGEILRRFKGYITAAAVSPDGKTLAAARYDVMLYDTDSGEEKAVWPAASQSEMKGMAFSPNGQLLATGTDDGTVTLWDVASGAAKPFPADLRPCRSLVFSRDGTRVIVGIGPRIKILDTRTGQTVLALQGQGTTGLSAVTVSSDGCMLAGAWGNAIWGWAIGSSPRR